MAQLGRTDLTIGQIGNNSYMSVRNTPPTLALLICPDDAQKVGGSNGPLTYVVNGGCYNVYNNTSFPADWPQNGAWDYRYPIPGLPDPRQGTSPTLDNIARHDGTGTTLALSENLDAVSYIMPAVSNTYPYGDPTAESNQCMLWDPSVQPLGGNAPPAQATLINYMAVKNDNSPNDNAFINLLKLSSIPARPSSNHPGGVVVTFCDGHQAFISDSITYGLYSTLMTSAGSQCQPPNNRIVPPNPNPYLQYQVFPLDPNSIPTN
jgi:prepilin-type processing-associated H-X9-DG protein